MLAIVNNLYFKLESMLYPPNVVNNKHDAKKKFYKHDQYHRSTCLFALDASNHLDNNKSLAEEAPQRKNR